MATGMDPRLVTKGRRQTVLAVAQQARCSIELAHRHAAALATAGWSASDTAALGQALVALEQLGLQRVVTRNEAHRSTEVEGEAIEQAKRFLRRLRRALPRVLRVTRAVGVTADSFVAGGKLKRSQPRIAEYLLRISWAVAALDGELEAYFDGRSAAAELERIRRALGEASTGQALAFADLSVEVRGGHQAKGVVIEMLEDLRRLAANAFVEEPETARLFRLHLLRRAGRARRQAGEEVEGGGVTVAGGEVVSGSGRDKGTGGAAAGTAGARETAGKGEGLGSRGRAEGGATGTFARPGAGASGGRAIVSDDRASRLFAVQGERGALVWREEVRGLAVAQGGSEGGWPWAGSPAARLPPFPLAAVRFARACFGIQRVG